MEPQIVRHRYPWITPTLAILISVNPYLERPNKPPSSQASAPQTCGWAGSFDIFAFAFP